MNHPIKFYALLTPKGFRLKNGEAQQYLTQADAIADSKPGDSLIPYYSVGGDNAWMEKIRGLRK